MNKRKLTREQKSKIVASLFLMATSAIGPAFLTQTADFTGKHGANFAFVILVSVILSIGAQINIWRILTVSGKYGQDLANDVLPGLGYVLAFFIVLGGLAFNIGNVAGAGMGLNTLFGLDTRIGAAIAGLVTILIFLSKNGRSIMDQVVKILGAGMIILALLVSLKVQPPYSEVILRTFAPDSIKDLLMPIITIVGGTVGGYITFSGAHRLIESSMTGKENIRFVDISASSGIVVTGLMRILLFLAAFAAISAGQTLNPTNPMSTPFEMAFGRTGEIIFGCIISAAAVSSVIGAAYTSASFLKTFHKKIEEYNNLVIAGFITISTLIYISIGRPVVLLILAGAFNGLITPLTLGVCLLAAGRKDIVKGYRHPKWLLIYGIISCIIIAIAGILSLRNLSALWMG